jgi:hypothetical protein
MVKQLTLPSRFAFLQVMSTSGEVAFQAGPPIREVPTAEPGAVRTGRFD